MTRRDQRSIQMINITNQCAPAMLAICRLDGRFQTVLTSVRSRINGCTIVVVLPQQLASAWDRPPAWLARSANGGGCGELVNMMAFSLENSEKSRGLTTAVLNMSSGVFKSGSAASRIGSSRRSKPTRNR